MQFVLQYINSMRFFDSIKNMVKMTDLFYSTEILRYDNQTEYTTFTGGLISLAIIITVVFGFANMIISTLSLSSINFIYSISKNSSPSYSQLTTNKGSMFMMAVQVWEVDMVGPIRYFDLLMLQMDTSDGYRISNTTTVPMESCTPEHWSDFPEIAAEYDSLSMKNWFCPPRNYTFELSGDYTSNIYQYINISVNPCDSSLDPSRPCANSSQLTQLFVDFQDAIRFKIYYTNPLINPGQKKYKSYYLESSNYINFGQTVGGQAYLYGADYSVVTDNSIWPYSDYKSQSGAFIQDKNIIHPWTTFYGTYVSYYIVKSPTSYSYLRTVQKISNVFSFIGGLVSAISSVFFLLKSYNSFVFDVSLAICIFKSQEHAQIDNSNIAINLLTYIRVSIYKFCKYIGKERDWPQTSFLISCHEEINKQLDIKSLVKRITFMEYCITNLIDDCQLQLLQIQKPSIPKEVAKIRQKCESEDIFQENSNGQISSETNENLSSVILNICKKTKDILQLQYPVKIGKQVEIQAHQIQLKYGNIEHSDNVQNCNQKIEQQKQDHTIEDKVIVQVNRKKNRFSRNLQILKKTAQEGNLLSKNMLNKIELNANHFPNILTTENVLDTIQLK